MDQPAHILIVDDDQQAAIELGKKLKPIPFDISYAHDGEEALAKLCKIPPDLVLLKVRIPRISGFEICQRMKRDPKTLFIPVVIVAEREELDDKLKAIELGADDFLVQPINPLELTTRIKSLLNVKLLHDDLDSSENILFSLAQALEAKDSFTRGHSERVATLSVSLAKRLGILDREIELIRKGALLHDIGKIGTKESILLKSDKLTDDEMKHIRLHPKLGYDICVRLKSLAPCLSIIRSHHERLDGRGYPDGLSGDEIPLPAKIVAVADAFDSMTNDRPYRPGMGEGRALEIFATEIKSGQWEPRVVRTLLDLKTP